MYFRIYFVFVLSSLLLSQVLADYKVPGLKPKPGHIINVAKAPVGVPIATPKQVAQLPKFFDVRKHWPKCSNITSHISDQGFCGACWAVSAADLISDRLCIASKGRIQKRISAYHLLTCCGLGYCADGLNDFGGCRGGDTFGAFSYYDKYGLVTEDCMPFPVLIKNLGIYDFPRHMNVKCETKCEEPKQKSTWGSMVSWVKRSFGYSSGLNYTKELHKGITYYRLPNDEATIRNEIYNHGPVIMQFYGTDFPDEKAWKDGEFYFCSKQNATPTHGARAIGWGVHKKFGPYWLLANSFGKSWNRFGGLFKMVRGKNLCNLEKFVVCGIPKVDY